MINGIASSTERSKASASGVQPAGRSASASALQSSSQAGPSGTPRPGSSKSSVAQSASTSMLSTPRRAPRRTVVEDSDDDDLCNNLFHRSSNVLHWLHLSYCLHCLFSLFLKWYVRLLKWAQNVGLVNGGNGFRSGKCRTRTYENDNKIYCGCRFCFVENCEWMWSK